jgi:N6-adenosine-specific RNA methylase IME4
VERWLDDIKKKQSKYAALEIFARHLVAGWTSWGNECLKFQDVRYWVPEDEEEYGDTKPVTISVD